MVKGGSPDERFAISPYLRDYLLVKNFGWTKQQIDEQPAVWLDWIMQIHTLYAEIENQSVQG